MQTATDPPARGLSLTARIWPTSSTPLSFRYAFVANGAGISRIKRPNLLLEFNFWLHNSGFAATFSFPVTVSLFHVCQKKDGWRLHRLRVPTPLYSLLFGMLVIVLPGLPGKGEQWCLQENFCGFLSPASSYRRLPMGNLSCIHLGSFLYLLVYDIVCAPLLRLVDLGQAGKGL